jgi:hypothetical protein
MKLEYFKKCVDEILKRIGSPMGDGSYMASDWAHQEEDDLYKEFIREIAKRKTKDGEIAKQLLRIADLPEYERWYS